MLTSMEDGPLWPACDAQVPLHHQVGMFNVPESHGNLLGVPESPFLPSWTTETYEMADIALMSSTSDPVAFDHVLNTLPAVSTDVNDLVGGNPKFRQMDQWGHFYQSTDMTDMLAVTHHHPYLPAYNSPAPVTPSHLQQECASIYNNTNLECASVYKQPLCSTPVQHNRGIASTDSQGPPQYGGPSMGMFEATVPLVSSTINSTPLGSCAPNLGAHLHVPKQHQPNPLGPNTGVSVSIPEGRSGGSLPSGPGVGTTIFTPKQISNSVPMHKPDVPSEEPKMRTFNPGPYKPTQKPQQQHEHQEALSAIWGKSGGSSSSTPSSSIPKLSNVNNGFDKRPLPIIASRSTDTRESTADWPAVRKVVVGGGGGCIGITGNEKGTGLMQQRPESETPKCALPPRSQITPMINGNTMHKRPHSWVDDNRNQMFLQNKKPMPGKFHEGCSRLEVISAAAHQKVQNNTSGRALGPALNTNLKPRARQGSANDPQSIAARVRRERISERLKLLQTLIPNGDKVDMVTMLDKAIIYVQCLDLQIRMLKNDSLWPKAVGLLPNSLEELRNLAGPEFVGGTCAEDAMKNMTTEVATDTMKDYEASQPSANKE